MDDDDLEYTLLNKREVLVYQIPPASSSTGHKADDWKKCIWRGRLRIAGKGKDLSIKLLEGSGNLFAQCAIPGGDYNSYVERVIDSSRYFVLKITNGDRHAFIGLGFEDRNDAFDFNCTLADFKSTWIDREKEAEMPTPSSMPAKDLSLKEGQTIKINLPGGKSRRSREAEGGGYGGGILAPPPSSGSRRQAPAVPAVPAVPAAPAVPAGPAVSSMSSPEAANDFFGDFNDFQAAPGDTGGPSRSPQAAQPAEIFGGPSRSPQAAAPVDLFGGAVAQAVSPAPASLDLFGGASSSPQVSALAASDPFAGPVASAQGPQGKAPAVQAAPAPAAPWPGDAFGGFSSAPPKPAAAPASSFSPVRPSPARGKDPFDDLDIFK